MKFRTLRWFAAFLFLLLCVVVALWLRQAGRAPQALVQVEVATGYALPIGQDDTLYFTEASVVEERGRISAEYHVPNNNRRSLVKASPRRISAEYHAQNNKDQLLLRGLHTEKAMALLRTQVWGYRVERDGAVQCLLPTLVDTLQGKALRNLLLATQVASRKRVAVMQRQRSELAYYRRTHSVADDGFHEVMAFALKLDQALKNERRCLHLLENALCERAPKAVKHHRLLVENAAYEAIGNGGTLSLLRPLVAKEHLSVLSGQKLLSVLRPERDSVWRHVDSAGTYFSLLRRDTLWQGTAVGQHGEYYQGTFDDSLRRHGFGFGIDHRLVKCGVWERNHFHGERMIYNAHRIYGIDISRYQHEQGGKVYPIDWSRLRIKHLGTISRKRVRGRVDYPVRFVFIKVTQGTTIKSKYYKADLRAARAHGIPVAPYHFFSPKTNGAAQAVHFIQHAHLAEATLPPMLDVEPMPSEIEKMGGIEVLFREMREWLTIVERAAGRKPVLYLPQYFINRYMDQAPAWLRAYDVWIARYGEYKPYVRLLLWQLSPDGRVEGIRGEVDINVFNGTTEDFLRWTQG